MRTRRARPHRLTGSGDLGAALSCLIAAKGTSVDSNHARPFGDLLDEVMGALRRA